MKRFTGFLALTKTWLFDKSVTKTKQRVASNQVIFIYDTYILIKLEIAEAESWMQRRTKNTIQR